MTLVWVGGKRIAGVVDRTADGYTFAYDRDCLPENAVSLTMPISLESYSYRSMLPIFQMNLPEGALREVITRRFSKTIQGFDDLDLLAIMGRSQIGRLRYSNEAILEDVPPQSVKEILNYEGTEDLFQSLMERFSTVSGISGAQPKVMIRDSEMAAPEKLTVKGATHIVKTWGDEFPELAANEYFCLTVAERAGLVIPNIQLSDNGKFLVVERFDITPEGGYLGFEDFCSLNGIGSTEKYDSSYEKLAKRIRDFVSPAQISPALRTYFKSFAVSCALQNGDAHLKNFGVLYSNAESEVSYSPTFDIVSTTPYVPNDSLALTLGGSKRFPSRKNLVEFARQHCNLSSTEASQILQEIADAISRTRGDVLQYMNDRPAFKDIGERMIKSWDEGIRLSLRSPGKN